MNSTISGIDFKKEARRAECYRYRAYLYLLSIVIILGSAGNILAAGSSVIRDISMMDNTIQIKVDGPIKYSIYKPGDPFAVVVELDNISIGQFKDKIISTVPGVTEIIPTQVETPNFAARLTILLQSPAEIRAEVNGDSLILNLDNSTDLGQGRPKIQGSSSSKTRDGMAKAITDIVFDKDGDVLELIIKADGKLMEPAVFQLDKTLGLEIPGVAMEAKIPSEFPAGLKDIRVGTERGRLKFDITLADKMTTEVYVLDDEVVVDILARDKRTKKPLAEKTVEIQGKVVNGDKVVSLDFQDADIVPILRLLGDVGGYNIVVHPDVKGKITMKLMNVPWNQAMDIILKTFNLEKAVEGNIIRIATVKTFQEEKKAVAENKELFGKAEDVATKIFTVNYANVDDITEHDEITKMDRKIPGIKTIVEQGKILSPRGTISVDARTRTIFVKDVASSIDEVQRLINVLDRPTRQVLIEAKVVEMNTDYVKSLGVDWGIRAQSGPSAQGIFGGSQNILSVPNTRNLNPVPTTIGTPFVPTQVPTALNLPATTSTLISPTSAITLGFLNRAQTLGLDLRLSAIEDTGGAKIISSPKILTLDNRSAVIKQGQKIPVTTPQSGSGGGAVTYTTVYIDANLKLTVTPQIAPDGSIQLRVEVNKDAPDYTHVDIQGNPTIDIKQALTQVMLNDGETVVIGGVFTSNETSDDSSVPGLGNLPILGSLFKRKTNEKHITEMLIFITPRITQ